MKKKILLICVCLAVLAAILKFVELKQWHKDILFDDYVSIRGYVDYNIDVDINDHEKVQEIVDYINSMHKREVSWNYNSKSPETILWLTNSDGEEEDIHIFGPCLIYGGKLYRISFNKFYRDLPKILSE